MHLRLPFPRIVLRTKAGTLVGSVAFTLAVATTAACTAPASEGNASAAGGVIAERSATAPPTLPDSAPLPAEPVAADSTSAVAALDSPAMLNPEVTVAHLAYLRSRQLLIPVPGVRGADLPNTFDEARSGGARRHDAIDILAPRGTPVLSVDAGRIARIDTSDRGGLSLYATDPSGRFVYYYAHLDAYRRGLRDGQSLERGDTLGFVGTTGNAPPGTPHLHFAISLLGDPRRWWDGTAVNPWLLLAGEIGAGDGRK